jgi:hypothetical protein
MPTSLLKFWLHSKLFTCSAAPKQSTSPSSSYVGPQPARKQEIN